MGHVVLFGDSIFDNARYVPDRPAVREQVQRLLPRGWSVTLLAVDGHQASDVREQLSGLPEDSTHLFISAGGNDALGASGILGEPAESVGEALALLSELQDRFRAEYREMLRAVRAVGKPTAVCTVYDCVPGLQPAEKVALGAFNDVILREAFDAGVPIIDLRRLCNTPDDYSPLSRIEPSFGGGAKIARVIAEVATGYDFSRRQSSVFP